jgi:hypothetical protein
MLKMHDKVRVLQIPRSSVDFSFERLSLVDKEVNIVGMRWDGVIDDLIYAVYDPRLQIKQWFHKKYLKLIEEETMHEFKVGDKVRVVRRIERENGWKNGWLPEMNMAINTSYVFTISEICPEGCYFKRDWNESSVLGIHGYSLGYPLSSLELVSTPSKMIVNKNYQYLNGAKLGSGGPLSDLCLTIATTITKYPDGSAKVDWTVAFKHPKDKFNRELARNAVESRETKELLLQKGFNRNEIVFKILCDLVYHEAFLSDQYKKYVLFLVAQYSNNILRKELFK